MKKAKASKIEHKEELTYRGSGVGQKGRATKPLRQKTTNQSSQKAHMNQYSLDVSKDRKPT